MIFIDTSAIYALSDATDPWHAVARRRLEALLGSGEDLLTHSYVLVESMAVVQRRLGVEAALRLAEGAERFLVQWIDAPLHAEALRLFRSRGRSRSQPSFVDQVSFVVMRMRGVTTAFAFDAHFEEEGFRSPGD